MWQNHDLPHLIEQFELGIGNDAVLRGACASVPWFGSPSVLVPRLLPNLASFHFLAMLMKHCYKSRLWLHYSILHYPLALTFVIDNRMVSCLAHYESPIPIGPRYNRVADEVLVALSIGSRLSFADQMLRLRAVEGIHHFEDFICIHR